MLVLMLCLVLRVSWYLYQYCCTWCDVYHDTITRTDALSSATRILVPVPVLMLRMVLQMERTSQLQHFEMVCAVIRFACALQAADSGAQRLDFRV